MKIETEITGLESLKQNLTERILNKARSGAASELAAIGEEIMTDSKQVVPVDTGNLMNTGHVAPVEEEPDGVSVTLGYGGPAASYAMLVHEDLTPNRNWSRPGSGPKYLENPTRQKEPEIPGRLAAAINSALSK